MCLHTNRSIHTVGRMTARTRVCRLTSSGFKLTDAYAELDAAVAAGLLERACCLAAEIACTPGGQCRALTNHLINAYCSRCVDSNRSQMALVRTSLAYIGDGTNGSPGDTACRGATFRKGICTLVLLVASASRKTDRDIEEVFRRLPCDESVTSTTVEDVTASLRAAVGANDPRAASAVIRLIAVKGLPPPPTVSDGNVRLPDARRLRIDSRRDHIWRVWELAVELAEARKVTEYVGDCLNCFAWGHCKGTTCSRIHLLWYAFLVIVKGAPRSGPHPIDPSTFRAALSSIDDVFDEILSRTAAPRPPPSPPHAPAQVDFAPSPDVAACVRPPGDLECIRTVDKVNYLMIVTHHDAAKVWEVERDRIDVAALNHLDSSTRTVIFSGGPSKRPQQSTSVRRIDG